MSTTPTTLLRRLIRRQTPRQDGQQAVRFVCNICGATSTVTRADLGREANSCSACHSIVRWRSVVAAVSVALFGESRPMDRFPTDFRITGLGMSDWEGYAVRLAQRLSYRNTFYDEPPQFDVMAPVEGDMVGSCDFVISSDVLEHVAPPYEQALANILRVLKPGGVLVLTVPLKPDGPTDEHFPDLYQYDLVTLGGDQVLVNRTRSGAIEVFENLVFHGGPGATLEMRLLALPDLLASLRRVGFVDVAPFDQPIPEHGILWNDPCGWPIVARAPR